MTAPPGLPTNDPTDGPVWSALTTRSICVLVTVALLHAALFWRSLNYPFVWDDKENFTDPLFDRPLWQGVTSTQLDHLDPAYRKLRDVHHAHDSYRPLLFLSYKLDDVMFHRDPRGMHAHSILLALIASLTFFWVCARWLMPANLALLAFAIFALHPLQVEPSVYISARGDLLAGIFGLLGTAAVLRLASGNGRPLLMSLGAGLFYVCSVLCKEAYIGLPLAIAALLCARQQLRRGIPAVLTLVGLGAAYLVFRFSVIDSAAGGVGMQSLASLPRFWLDYLLVSLFPFHLSTERMYLLPHGVVLGWLYLGLCLALALVVWHRRHRWPAAPGWILAGLVWHMVLLAPSVVVTGITGALSDRYAYLPLAGFAVSLCHAIHWAGRLRRTPRRLLGAAAATWGAMLLVVSWLLVPVWRSDLALYSHAVSTTPQSSMAWYRLGYVHAVNAKWSTAAVEFRRAIALDPSNTRALNNLAVTYIHLGKLDRAEATLNRLRSVSHGGSYRLWYNLATISAARGDTAAACRYVGLALRLNPLYQKARAFVQRSCPTGDTPSPSTIPDRR